MNDTVFGHASADKRTDFEARRVAVGQYYYAARLSKAFYQLLLLFVLENAEAVGLYYNGIEDCGELYFIILSLDDDRLFYLYHFTINTIRRLFSGLYCHKQLDKQFLHNYSVINGGAFEQCIGSVQFIETLPQNAHAQSRRLARNFRQFKLAAAVV